MKRYSMLLLLVVGLMTSAATAQALGAAPTPTPTKRPIPTPTPVQNAFLYSVKFLCGLQQQPSSAFKPPQEPPVKPGNYATAVNVHNFRPSSVCVSKKAVVANPEFQAVPGPISPFRPFKLVPDGAFEIDCTDIVSLFPAGIALPPFVTGFVEIQSPVQLSVTGVYTSQTCHPSSTGAGCVFGEVSLDVVPEPFYIAPATSNVCGPVP